MKLYRIFYWVTPSPDLVTLSFSDAPVDITVEDVIHGAGRYRELFTIKAENLEDVYTAMQGERWSPEGEARGFIESLGLYHTSMSVGDVVIDEQGRGWICKGAGWGRLAARRVRGKLAFGL